VAASYDAVLNSNLEASEASEASEESWMEEEEEEVDIPWPWMLFVLSGNTKVANRRQRDLGTYLRLNLAARLDADYNDVAINRILLTQDSILANISVEPSHLVGIGAVGLETLAQGNVTLLELSGHEFTVDRIIRVTELVDQREINMEMASERANSEVNVYGAVGAVFLFLMVALLLGLSFNSPCKSNEKYLPTSDREQMENSLNSELKSILAQPPVIYTEQLARDVDDGIRLLDPRSHFISSSRNVDHQS